MRWMEFIQYIIATYRMTWNLRLKFNLVMYSKVALAYILMSWQLDINAFNHNYLWRHFPINFINYWITITIVNEISNVFLKYLVTYF